MQCAQLTQQLNNVLAIVPPIVQTRHAGKRDGEAYQRNQAIMKKWIVAVFAASGLMILAIIVLSLCGMNAWGHIATFNN